MKNLGYGKDYQYPHTDPDGIVHEQYLPDSLRGDRYYFPKKSGMEREIMERLDSWRKVRKSKERKGAGRTARTSDAEEIKDL